MSKYTARVDGWVMSFDAQDTWEALEIAQELAELSGFNVDVQPWHLDKES